MAIPVKLPVFEGPLDLLLHLIEKNKIDIYDIPIVQITGQYLDYVRQMDREDMDVMSEFLVMAATLLDIKSRMLLPREKNEETGEEEGDPREELVQRLLEYKMYKYLSEELAVRREEAGVRFFRAQKLPKEVQSYQPPIDYKDLLGKTDIKGLQKVFGEVLRRKKSRRDPIRSGFGKIRREEVNIDTKTLYIRAYLQAHPRTDFRALLESRESREEVIVTFLILLELMKHQKVHIEQDCIGGSILIVAGRASEGKAEEENSPADSEESEAAADLVKAEEPGGGRKESRALLAPRHAEVTAAAGAFFEGGADDVKPQSAEKAGLEETDAVSAFDAELRDAVPHEGAFSDASETTETAPEESLEAAAPLDGAASETTETAPEESLDVPETTDQTPEEFFDTPGGAVQENADRRPEEREREAALSAARRRRIRSRWRPQWLSRSFLQKNRRDWGKYWTAQAGAARFGQKQGNAAKSRRRLGF